MWSASAVQPQRLRTIRPGEDYTEKTLRGFSEILGALDDWTNGRPGADFGLPDVYRDSDASDAGKEAVSKGMEAATELADTLEPADADPDKMDADTAETLALAVIIQTWDFIRGGAWDSVDVDVLPKVFGNVERDHRMVDPLRKILAEGDQGRDRAPVIAKLTSLERHLSQYTREGRKLMDELGIDEDSVSCDLSSDDNPISFDPMDDSGEPKSPLLLAARKLTDSMSASSGSDRPSIGQTMRTALDTEELRARTAGDKAVTAARKGDRLRKFRLQTS